MRRLRGAVALAVVLLLSACASAGPRPGAWQSLFDGVTTRGWHNVGKAMLDPRWQVVDGVLVLTAPGGGDIVTDAQFDDFELELDWRLAPGGNSGVFYRAADAEPVWRRAAEYQLLDDAAAEDRFVASHRTGAAYDLFAPEGAVLRPAGEYNRARVVACGPRIEHWLNGVRVASYIVGSDEWQQRLQDHGAVLRVRNARIRTLSGCGA